MSAGAAAVERGPRLRSAEEEQAYLFGMAGLCFDRGAPNLARSYQLAAGLYAPDEVRAEQLARSWVHHADRLAARWSAR